MIVALVLLIQNFRRDVFETQIQPFGRLRGFGTQLCGAVVGFAVGFTSVGSGSLVAPFLLAVYPFSPARVVGTDVFHAALLTSVTAMAHWGLGTVNWRLVSTLLLGSVQGRHAW